MNFLIKDTALQRLKQLSKHIKDRALCRSIVNVLSYSHIPDVVRVAICNKFGKKNKATKGYTILVTMHQATPGEEHC